MSGLRLDPGQLPRDQRRNRRERHLLALAGGGYRGLFSAEILAAAEEEGRAPLSARFDLIAGTSIGGILAIGLACGIPARVLAAFIREQGSAIFRPRPLSFAGFSRSRYGSDGLRRAIEILLGKPLAQRPFTDIPVPLVVSAVHEGTGMPHFFRTCSTTPGEENCFSTLDVALATSAAPTYFPPHRIGDSIYVDGGLVANAPDLVVLAEAIRRFGCSLDECQLLSIGTAGASRAGTAEGAPGKIGWAARHGIIDLIMTAQEALAIAQVQCLHPGAFLRIDAKPAAPISLDDVTLKTTGQLIALAHQTIENVRQTHAPVWRRFLAHSVV